MKFVWSPQYEADIGAHVFPTEKYRLIRDMLLETDMCHPADFVIPEPATEQELLYVHTTEYLDDLSALRITNRTLHSELPITKEVIDAYKLAAGGTILAARTALIGSPAICCHIGGGFHHAFADRAEGFCYINDIAVAIRTLQSESRIQRATVIDFDLHQGNGTAHIFENDSTVFTVSLHQENNYPTKQTSSIDIGLEDFTDDTEYLTHVDEILSPALDSHQPDLVIYVAGADPYQDDKLGRLKITMHGLYERDLKVLEACVNRGIPVVTVTAGGYAEHVIDTVKIHAQTCRIAAKLAHQD